MTVEFVVNHVQNGGIVYLVVVNGEKSEIGIMSRLIIRNLPKNIREERIRSIFAAKGELTDVKLCHTKDGKFRRFGFIGYKTEDQAREALQHFNSSFIDTSKITVDFAKSLGDESLPRPWSRYSEGSSANDRLKKRKEKKTEKFKDRISKPTEAEDPSETHSINKQKSSVVNEKNKKKRTKALDDLEHDTEFQEFLSVHKHRGSKQTWSNDNVDGGQLETKENQTRQRKEKTITATKSSESELKYDDSDDSGNEDEVYDASGTTEEWTEDTKDSEENDEEETKIAKDSKLSDMDYLKSKIVSSKQKTLKIKRSRRSQNNKSDDSENEEERNRESLDDEPMDTYARKTDQDSSDNDDDNDMEEGYDDEDEDDNNDTNDSPKESSLFGTIKMRGLPFKAKEQHIKDFFAPLRIVDIRIIKNVNGKPTGCAFVDFGNEKDIKEALKRDRDCIEGRYIELFRDKGEQSLNQEIEKEKPWMKTLAAQGGEEEFESIAEHLCEILFVKAKESLTQHHIAKSGRLFLRNLAYACSEEDLQNLFEKFGPLTETYLPLDKITNKPIGIGFVTFVMPEHAVKAFNELDGKIFQGRLLHILPSKAKETKDEDADTATSFKSKRDAKKKSLSSHDHNWNTLFLGMNAVADIMADQYNTTKGSILDDASSRSLAVRMALGETQVVTETRKFLVSEGVRLDVFGQPSAKRSKTVILVKNLPFNTPSEELRNIFASFGKVARLVLPPSGITALVEFFEPSQAKKAFQKLAYSKFKHVPLYLEWAPLGVFSGKPEEKLDTSETTKEDKETPGDKESDTQDDEGGGSENTEGTSVFVKNLNFDTTEDSLKEAFSKMGPLLSATIAKKKDPKKPGHLLSMGYGFVEYKKRSDALKAIKELQNSSLEGHTLELKMSHRKASDKVVQRKSASTKKQNSSKILVRNVPFEASKKELKELFGTFGEIKTLRLPQKLSGTGTHRGFAFVDFLTKQDAKRAFESLCSSTHLYGRRLVLEWAEDEDSVDALRKRTAEHFHGTPKTAKKKKDILDDLLDTEMPE